MDMEFFNSLTDMVKNKLKARIRELYTYLELGLMSNESFDISIRSAKSEALYLINTSAVKCKISVFSPAVIREEAEIKKILKECTE